MRIGMVGLGRMGANMSRRLAAGGVVVDGPASPIRTPGTI